MKVREFRWKTDCWRWVRPQFGPDHEIFDKGNEHARISCSINEDSMQRTEPKNMKKSIKVISNVSFGLATMWALSVGVERAQANNLFGIDVSHYQGSINWGSVHSCGANYAFAKATEGVSYTDPNFSGYMRSEERRVGKECRSRWSP